MTETGEREAPPPLVETNWLAKRLDKPDLRILDCSVIMNITDEGDRKYSSGKAELENAHIPGSGFVDIQTDLGSRYSPTVPLMAPLADFGAAMESCGIGDGNQVVLYDGSNHAWAACIRWMLRVCGFDAMVLHGGWQKWKAEKRPESTLPLAYPRGSLTIRQRPELMATKEAVLASISDDKTSIINGLSAAEHRGKLMRFPRASRIKGSVNVDCEMLVDPDTHNLLPNDQLHEISESAGALNADHAITYCGGGVAASLDALALTILGFPRVSVYHGSLAEWTTDSELPMETD